MAGHSQFKNIMHRKGAQDAKRAKVFTKLQREIYVSAKLGIPEPEKNPRLRAAIQAARAANMPKDNIERTIKRASGAGQGEDYAEIRYEGYGPSGVAVIVEALTDNRNRTASEVRSTFSKNGGSLGESGSVSFMFNQVGELVVPAGGADFDAVFEAAVEAGADDVEESEEGFTVVCEVASFAAVRDAMEAGFGDLSRSELVWRPTTTAPLDEDAARTMLKLIDTLEENDDVQKVFANFEISDEVMASLTA